MLFQNNLKEGILFSINHGGDSDSTGSITGNILGVINGQSQIPAIWVSNLASSGIVLQVAMDLYERRQGNRNEYAYDWWDKYPGY